VSPVNDPLLGGLGTLPGVALAPALPSREAPIPRSGTGSEPANLTASPKAADWNQRLPGVGSRGMACIRTRTHTPVRTHTPLHTHVLTLALGTYHTASMPRADHTPYSRLFLSFGCVADVTHACPHTSLPLKHWIVPHSSIILSWPPSTLLHSLTPQGPSSGPRAPSFPGGCGSRIPGKRRVLLPLNGAVGTRLWGVVPATTWWSPKNFPTMP
jgi:hypothetical protein